MLRLIGFLVLFPMLLSASPAGGAAQEGNIPRFSILANNLYRGGQPSEEGFQYLKKTGVKTIINLRGEDNSEAKIVEKLGMNYVQIPLDEVRPWTRIPDALIAKYFEVLNNPANYPIFFHCLRGADRTGAMAALYRIGVQGWDAQKAYDEARDVGMRWFYSGLKTQIYAFHPTTQKVEIQPAEKP